MKFAVGVMLSSFGMFWGAEGAGADWPGGEGALLVIVPCLLLIAVVIARWLTRWVSLNEPRVPVPASPQVAEEVLGA